MSKAAKKIAQQKGLFKEHGRVDIAICVALVVAILVLCGVLLGDGGILLCTLAGLFVYWRAGYLIAYPSYEESRLDCSLDELLAASSDAGLELNHWGEGLYSFKATHRLFRSRQILIKEAGGCFTLREDKEVVACLKAHIAGRSNQNINILEESNA